MVIETFLIVYFLFWLFNLEANLSLLSFFLWYFISEPNCSIILPCSPLTKAISFFFILISSSIPSHVLFSYLVLFYFKPEIDSITKIFSFFLSKAWTKHQRRVHFHIWVSVFVFEVTRVIRLTPCKIEYNRILRVFKNVGRYRMNKISFEFSTVGLSFAVNPTELDRRSPQLGRLDNGSK